MAKKINFKKLVTQQQVDSYDTPVHYFEFRIEPFKNIVRLLTLEEIGLYTLLLTEIVRSGPVKDDYIDSVITKHKGQRDRLKMVLDRLLVKDDNGFISDEWCQYLREDTVKNIISEKLWSEHANASKTKKDVQRTDKEPIRNLQRADKAPSNDQQGSLLNNNSSSNDNTVKEGGVGETIPPQNKEQSLTDEQMAEIDAKFEQLMDLYLPQWVVSPKIRQDFQMSAGQPSGKMELVISRFRASPLRKRKYYKNQHDLFSHICAWTKKIKDWEEFYKGHIQKAPTKRDELDLQPDGSYQGNFGYIPPPPDYEKLHREQREYLAQDTKKSSGDGK